MLGGRGAPAAQSRRHTGRRSGLLVGAHVLEEVIGLSESAPGLAAVVDPSSHARVRRVGMIVTLRRLGMTDCRDRRSAARRLASFDGRRRFLPADRSSSSRRVLTSRAARGAQPLRAARPSRLELLQIDVQEASSVSQALGRRVDRLPQVGQAHRNRLAEFVHIDRARRCAHATSGLRSSPYSTRRRPRLAGISNFAATMRSCLHFATYGIRTRAGD